MSSRSNGSGINSLGRPEITTIIISCITLSGMFRFIQLIHDKGMLMVSFSENAVLFVKYKANNSMFSYPFQQHQKQQ